ncbi:hypothetical protein K502DRAFT_361951 [Neoconidiobolus thromboides FSU 785]|nr:hypothetical protein K502DRAFT_361951 [Neoconidiobolus thromboides FSU 785]
MIPIIELPHGLNLKKTIKKLLKLNLYNNNYNHDTITNSSNNPYNNNNNNNNISSKSKPTYINPQLIPNKSHLSHSEIMNIHLLKNEAWYLNNISNIIIFNENNNNINNNNREQIKTYLSNLPILSEKRYRYFEVLIENKTNSDIISIGFSARHFDQYLMLGQHDYSYGLCINDSKLYSTMNNNNNITISFPIRDLNQSGSIIGCGLTPNNELFYTFDQKLIVTPFILNFECFPAISYYNISLDSYLKHNFKYNKNTTISNNNIKCKLKLNFGTRPYIYNDALFLNMSMFCNSFSNPPSPSYELHQNDLLWCTSGY